MTDAAHFFSFDLALSATGDLLTVERTGETTQRVLRRLLTNLRGYLWHPSYGAGLPGYIGEPFDRAALTALIQSQMYLEAGVSHDPEPQVRLAQIPNGISAQITYISAETGQPESLSFDVTQ